MKAQEPHLKALRRERKLRKKQEQRSDNRRSIFLIQRLSTKSRKAKKK